MARRNVVLFMLRSLRWRRLADKKRVDPGTRTTTHAPRRVGGIPASPPGGDQPRGGGPALERQSTTPGLRRDEVSLLAGVGLSWYTWIEQGRDITPSVSVLDALARVYDLDPHAGALPCRARPALWRSGLRQADQGSAAGEPEVPGTVAAPRGTRRSGGDRADRAPELGRLTLHHPQSIPTSHPDLRLTQFVPADEATRSALARAQPAT